MPPDLTWPSQRGTGTRGGLKGPWAPPRRSTGRQTSGLGWPEGTQQTGGPGLGLSDRLPAGPPRSGGGQGTAPPGPPPPPLFVNLVNCKSSTVVFLTLLVCWAPPGTALLLLTALLPGPALLTDSPCAHGPPRARGLPCWTQGLEQPQHCLSPCCLPRPLHLGLGCNELHGGWPVGCEPCSHLCSSAGVMGAG